MPGPADQQRFHKPAGGVGGRGADRLAAPVGVFQQLVAGNNIEQSAGEQETLVRRLGAAKLVDPSAGDGGAAPMDEAGRAEIAAGHQHAGPFDRLAGNPDRHRLQFGLA